jgi:hypothetical protein
MQKLWLVGGIVASVLGTVIAVQGCASVSCDETDTCAPSSTTDGSNDGLGGDHQLTDGSTDGKNHKDSGDGGLDGSSDADTGPQPCTDADTPQKNPCVVTNDRGIFVAPASLGGSASGDGTREHPFATFAAAIPAAVAATKRVYACGATYAEAVSLGTTTDGVEIYGGLECPTPGDGGVADAGTIDSSMGPWSYNGTPAAIAPSATGYALDVESLTKGVHFEDMGFESMSATPTAYGTSSIAVMVNGSSNVTFVRAFAKAGDGAPGAPGAVVATTNYCATSTQGGAAATGGGGGNNGTCSCPVFGSSAGGAGGGGAAGGGAVGIAGSSTPGAAAMAGGYDGKPGNGAVFSPFSACSNGDYGANGVAQSGGTAGAPGSLASGGWIVAIAGAGQPGDPGQGGGGGGGSLTLGGGGAGAGGCGGNGAPGGGGAGASIAVAVVNSGAKFTGVSLHTGAGGAGGVGAQGEQGQAGGTGGLMIPPACSGAPGGQGAGGSGGGGGAGGPSVGIAWTPSGMPPIVDGATITTTQASLTSPSKFVGGSAGSGVSTGGAAGPAAAGDPGNVGLPGNKGTDGPNGATAAVEAF